jgi:hypothetical protein
MYQACGYKKSAGEFTSAAEEKEMAFKNKKDRCWDMLFRN